MATTTATELADEIFDRADDLLDELDGQLLVSQNRWVDHLLDLYNLVEIAPLQALIERTLSDIRHVGSVHASWMSEQLLQLTAAVEIESAFDRTAALVG